ncbi:hypothetical protein L1049_027446 [Liquidambar formosana]|uniref:DDT domain-containing protein n=1 Tax=Liquidambar formosana TaxID=63359 RepID=A0AAP0RHF2_LIQFO
MAVSSSSSSSKPTTSSAKNDKKKKKNQNRTKSPSRRNKSPGVRLVGGRIYDSKDGKTCHQCRQKTRDFSASCRNQSEKKKCTLNFCHKCLLNRYGDKADEVAGLYDWKCPKCRGICNCSFCMKKRGHWPTGVLVRTAKTTGFSSVSEMLHRKSSENLDSKEMVRDVNTSPKNQTAPNKAPAVASMRKRGRGSGFDGKSDSKLQSKLLKLNGIGKEARETKLKKLRKNDGNDREAAAVPSTRKRGRGSDFDGKSDSILQPELLKSNGIGKETRENKLKRLRKNDGNDNLRRVNENDNVLTRKSSSNKHRISQEISKKGKRIHGQDDGRQSIKINSDMKVLKKISKSTKIEDNETEFPNNVNIGKGASKNMAVTQLQKCEKHTVEVQEKVSVVEIPMPLGIELNNVAAIDMSTEDVGYALQFLEFCKAFEKVLNLRKGQPEFLLRELACGRSRRRMEDSSVVQFHIQLLSIILKDSGKKYPSSGHDKGGNSWFKVFSKCISNSQYPLKELMLDSFDIDGGAEYDKLDFSKKLRLLNFLCDEALSTADLRSRIDEQNSKFVRREKKVKDEVLATEKNMKKKLQDEAARAILAKNGVPLSISEHKDLVSKIKTKAAQTLAETLEATDMVPKKKQRSDAVRSEPVLLDGSGRKFWRLRSYSDEMDILLQDVGAEDMLASKDKWFTYGVEQRAMVEKYISSSRHLRNEGENCLTSVSND